MSDISSFFPKIKMTGWGFKARCPRCNGDGLAFSFNTEKGVGCCYHADCAWSSSKHGVTLGRLRAYFSQSGIEERIPEVIQASEIADVKLPDEFTLLEDLPSGLRKTLLAYLDSRGIHHKLVERAKVGYCETGKYYGYLIFPVFDNSEVVYWQGRRFKNRERKFYNPESSQKGDYIYRIGKARKPKQIVLVESIFNVLTIQSVADHSHSSTLVEGLLGKTISTIQLDKVLMHERWLKEIVVALDPDAYNDAIEIANNFVGRIPSVKIPVWPEGEDINSLGREKSWELIWDTAPYQEQNRIRNKPKHEPREFYF